MATSFKAVSNARTNDRDGNGITSQEVGDQRGLDVNVIGGDITIDNAEINVELDAEDGDNVAIHNSSNGDEWKINPDGSGDVSVVDSVLPDGAATEATLLLAAASLTNLDTWELSGLPAGDNNIGNVDVVSSALPSGAATLAEQQTQTASLSVMDDWDESDRAKVNPIVGQAGVAAGTGVDSATTQRVSLATNIPLPAGSNSIGSVDTELPAAAALADNTANPTVPGVGAFGMAWQIGGVNACQRLRMSFEGGLFVNGVAADGETLFVGAPNIMMVGGKDALDAAHYLALGGDTGTELLVHIPAGTTNIAKAEDVAHVSGDTGVAIWGVRNDNLGTTYGANNDYTPIATNGEGGIYRGYYRASQTLTAINITYDDSPTTATSASMDGKNATKGLFLADVTESGAATDITFTLQMSDDNSTWEDYRVGPWVKYRFNSTTITTHTNNTLKIAEPFELISRYVRIIVTCTGTDASNTFTVANGRFTILGA